MRRNWSLALLVSLAACFGSDGFAQDYPTRPIKLYVPAAPGGTVDVVARLLAAKLGPELNGSVVIENRPGVAGVVGTDVVAKAAPDGYSLGISSGSTYVIAPLLVKNLPYDPEKDFALVTQVAAGPMLLVVKPSLPVKDLAEFVAYAKARPGQVNYASTGPGSSTHLTAALFQRAAGIEMTDIVYKGAGPATNDLVSEAVNLHAKFDPIVAALPYVQDGRLRALGVTSLKRNPVVPEIPAIAETYPGFEMMTWQGLSVPAGTPRAIIDKIHQATVRVMADPVLRQKFQELGFESMASTPEEATAYMRADAKRWSALLKDINLQPQ
jgi:tripartite-type tricarboxylate transporter receptor subunit TctC